MKRAHTPLVIGNWKMNPAASTSAKRLFQDVKKGAQRVTGVQVGIAPPALYLSELSGMTAPKFMTCGAQNVFWEKLGAHTGEISAVMLRQMKVRFSIIGHSERRALGETNEEVNKKVHALLKENLTAVVCVGEIKRDHSGNYLSKIETQVRKALDGVTKAKLGHVVIAYEPIWAIGTGKTATAEDAHEMKLFIQKTLADLYGRNLAMKIRILYGGSVNPKNAEELLSEGTVDGFLVGGASLRAADFVSIIKTASHA